MIHNSNEKVLLNQESEFSTMIQESNSSPNSEDTKTLNAKTNVEKLEKLNVLNFIKKSDSFIEIHPRKTSKWFAFGQIGYALFNNNPGLNFGGGILYEFDKLLYIESMLSYSYGNEAGIDNGEPRDSEKEIDLGLVINLNFINNKTSRFAFDLGIGYTRYWGTRIIRSNPIIINERSSSGRHLQGGISYHHRINNDIKLGAKFGVVSYDDTIVYFALKFYKRI